MSTQNPIASHYTSEDALERIDRHLREQGLDPAHPTLESLAPYDNFHSRGLAATLDLIALADFPAGARVLDIGGGLGGPARALASRTGAHVTVLDLTPAFVEQGHILSDRVGLSDKVDFELGDGTQMPFADGSFAGAWTQHATMNIANKNALYAEIHRVLKPGSRLAMHEVMLGNSDPIDYPMPWAGSAELSFLRSASDMRALIASAGFRELAWEDETPKVLEFVARGRDASPAERTGPAQQPPGQMILFGPAFVERIQNFGRNLGMGRLVVIQAMFERK
ncbi:MAG: class I SAM-dependent methyltransferase [Thermomicrobiales bacterium]|nr:class I SAM-dependent methyltransferase [Thermomicrobiales bacterium]MCO5223616.1 class I SAM-dependent methyltransferase [Thermomicrobiales bacterium]